MSLNSLRFVTNRPVLVMPYICCDPMYPRWEFSPHHYATVSLEPRQFWCLKFFDAYSRNHARHCLVLSLWVAGIGLSCMSWVPALRSPSPIHPGQSCLYAHYAGPSLRWAALSALLVMIRPVLSGHSCCSWFPDVAGVCHGIMNNPPKASSFFWVNTSSVSSTTNRKLSFTFLPDQSKLLITPCPKRCQCLHGLGI